MGNGIMGNRNGGELLGNPTPLKREGGSYWFFWQNAFTKRDPPHSSPTAGIGIGNETDRLLPILSQD